MFQKAIHFIKYHNAFAIGVILIFVFMVGAFAASPDLRENFISSQETVQSVDNSGILAANLGNFNFSLQIKEITQNESNYYIVYTYETMVIQDYVWQEVEKGNTLTVSKEALGNRDLGLYVAEELGEVIDYELSYLKVVQQIEKEKGLTQKIVATQYAGLIGRFLNPQEKVFEGYQLVVQEPLVVQPETVGEYTPVQSLEPTEQLTTEQQMPVDKELIRQIVQEILSQQQTQFAEQPAACQPAEEICDDGIDNDCDGIVDNPDICQVEATTTPSDSLTATGTGPSEVCDTYYYYDGDNDGYGYIQGSFQITCIQPDGHVANNSDCNDENPNINPGTTEICDDQIDNNCDGIIDNPTLCQSEATSTEATSTDATTIPEATTTPTTTPTTTETATTTSTTTVETCDLNHLNLCLNEIDCQTAEGYWYNETCNTEPETPACTLTEEVCDGLDNDCDGLIDEDLFQQCGSTDIGACQFGTQTCQAGIWEECQGAIEPAEEICGDNLDNNCDDQIDEGCPPPEPEPAPEPE